MLQVCIVDMNQCKHGVFHMLCLAISHVKMENDSLCVHYILFRTLKQ